MLLLKAHLTVDSGSRAEFLTRLQELTDASRADDGCLSFEFYEDALSPGSFVVLEEWQDRESLDRHELTEHLAAFKSAVGPMIIGSRDTRVYSVSHVGGLWD